MDDVIELFKQVLPTKRRLSGSGWVEFNCPACGDTRMRGGFMETMDGGFKYHCFNGGCRFEKPTGWSPEIGFGERVMSLFEVLGGDPTHIPIEVIMREPPPLFDAEGRRVGLQENAGEMYRDFSTVPLPPRSINLSVARSTQADEARRWLANRGGNLIGRYDFYWSPEYARHVIVPYIHHKGQIVGWMARKIDPGRHKNSHIKGAGNPEHYMLNQHLLSRKNMPRIYVLQGQFDAIALRGLATFGSRLTQPMINLLRASGKEVVLLSDYKGTEWKPYLTAARQNGFAVAAPAYRGWDSDPNNPLKDPGDAIKRNGMLHTCKEIGASVTYDYDHAEMLYATYSSINP